MEPIIAWAIVIALFFLIVYIGFLFVKNRLLFNHQLLSGFAKRFYNYLHSVKRISHICVSNYGYAPVDEEIASYDECHRHGLQLYKELVKYGGGFLVSGKSSILEVGCGKGAGAEFLINKFKPMKYTGIDFSEVAIAFCKEKFRNNKQAEFICADALKIPLDNHSVDIVINVESSHIYRDFDQFLKEVNRILKPGGKFLITDYRVIRNIPIRDLERKLTGNGFLIAGKRLISRQVRQACVEATGIRKKLIKESVPWYLRRYFSHYAMLNGSKKLRMLENGEIVYFIYQLEKGDPVKFRKIKEKQPDKITYLEEAAF